VQGNLSFQFQTGPMMQRTVSAGKLREVAYPPRRAGAGRVTASTHHAPSSRGFLSHMHQSGALTATVIEHSGHCAGQFLDATAATVNKTSALVQEPFTPPL
jgi:hypothetical protein